MGLIETEINELRSLLDDFKNKKTSADDTIVQVAIYSQIEKRLRMFLATKAMTARFGPAMSKDLSDTGVIGGQQLLPSPHNQLKAKQKVQ